MVNGPPGSCLPRDLVLWLGPWDRTGECFHSSGTLETKWLADADDEIEMAGLPAREPVWGPPSREALWRGVFLGNPVCMNLGEMGSLPVNIIIVDVFPKIEHWLKRGSPTSGPPMVEGMSLGTPAWSD